MRHVWCYRTPSSRKFHGLVGQRSKHRGRFLHHLSYPKQQCGRTAICPKVANCKCVDPLQQFFFIFYFLLCLTSCVLFCVKYHQKMFLNVFVCTFSHSLSGSHAALQQFQLPPGLSAVCLGLIFWLNRQRMKAGKFLGPQLAFVTATIGLIRTKSINTN